MKEQKNISGEQIQKIVKDFNFQPSFNKVIVTLNKEESIEEELTLEDNVMSSDQYVVAVGTHVKEYAPGDFVKLDLEKLMTPTQVETNEGWVNSKQIKINPIMINNVMFTILEDRFILGKFRTD